MSIYDEMGIRRVVNAAGHGTRLGGSIMEAETIQAMNEASKSFIYMEELAEKANKIISEITGAEAGIVTCGAAAAIAQASAGCITGADFTKIKSLPHTSGMKNEIIVQGLNVNDHVVHFIASGSKLVEIGSRNSATLSDLEVAINEKTVAIGYFVVFDPVYFETYNPEVKILSLQEVIEVAHSHDLPVIVDAAGELPPPENLRKFVNMGADLVIFSGGKAIRGPNDTGILCGRKDLVAAAALNGFPQDYPIPSGLFGIGRCMKVSKEQIVGQTVALKRYVKRDHNADMRKWSERVRYIQNEANNIPGVTARTVYHEHSGIPKVELTISQSDTKLSAMDITKILREGNPSIRTGGRRNLPRLFEKRDESGVLSREDFFKGESANRIYLATFCLQDGEEKMITDRLKKILGK